MFQTEIEDSFFADFATHHSRKYSDIIESLDRVFQAKRTTQEALDFQQQRIKMLDREERYLRELLRETQRQQ